MAAPRPTKVGSMVKGVSDGSRSVNARDVMNKPTTDLDVVAIPIDTLESITLGFRMEMFALTDDNDDGGRVMSTGGFGGTTLILEWRDDGQVVRQAAINCVDVLVRWVDTFDPEGAARLREAVTG